MKEFGAKLTLQDRMSAALKKAAQAQADFSRRVQQTRAAVQALGQTSASPTVTLSQNVSQTINKVKSAFSSLSNTRIMTKVEVQDEASKKAEAIRKKLKDLFGKVASPVIALKDKISEKIGRVKAKLKEIAATFTPIVKIRDLASRGLAKIKTTLGGLSKKALTIAVIAKDLATTVINKVRVGLETVKKLVVEPVLRVKDMASAGIAKVKNALGTFARKVTEPVVKIKDMASAGLQKVGGKLSEIGRKVVSPFVKIKDAISPKLQAIGSKLKSIGSFVARPLVAVRDKASAVLSKIGGALKTVGTAGGAALGAATVSSVKLAADFESGMSNVQAIAGNVSNGELKNVQEVAGKMGISFQQGASSTETAMNAMSAMAKKMGATTKFSAKEATDAYGYMAMAGWKSADMLNGIEPIMKLAGASGEDLATTSDIVTDALTAFGMQSSDTGRFTDVLAAASSNANTNVAMLGESFKYAAPVAGALGYSVEDTSVALGLMANSGIKASSAGTALRSMLTNMAKPTKQSAAAMDALGISLTDSSGQMKPFSEVMGDLRKSFSGLTEDQKASYAAALAGKTGMSGLLAVVNSSEKDFNKLSSAINGSNGACQAMYDTANNNLAGQLTIMKSTAEGIGIAFGEKLLPFVKQGASAFQSIGEKITEVLDPTTKAGQEFDAVGKVIANASRFIMEQVGRLAEPFQELAGNFEISKNSILQTVALIENGVVHAIDALMPVSQAIADAFGEMGSAIGEAGAQMAPMLADIAGNIAGMVAAVIPVVAQFVSMLLGQLPNVVAVIQSFFNAVSPVVQSLIPIIQAAIPVISSLLSGFFAILQEVLPVIGSIISSVLSATTPILQALFALIQAAIPVIINVIQQLASIWQEVWSVVQSVIEAVAPAVATAIQALIPVVQTIGQVIQTVLPVIASIVRIVGGVIKAVVPVIGTIFQAAAKIVQGAVNIIMSILQKLLGVVRTVLNGVKSALTMLQKAFSTVFNAIKGVVTTIGNAIKNALNTFGNGLKSIFDTIKSVLNTLKDAFSTAFDAIKSVVTGVCDSIKGAISGVSSAISGFVNSISGAITKAKEFASNVTKKVKDAAGFAYGKNRVPYDGYHAILHEGERVLTRVQADRYDRLTGTRGVQAAAEDMENHSAGYRQQAISSVTVQEKKAEKPQKHVTFSPNITIQNPVVRNDADIDAIVDILVKRLETISANVG